MDIQWKDRYNITYKEIDSQHKKLLDIVNDLNALITSSSESTDKIRTILLRLIEYASIHFKYEEKHMERCNYYLQKEHTREHRKFIKNIIEFNESMSNGGEHALEDMFEFLKNWYLDHIIQIDKMYEKYFKQYSRTADIKAIIFDYGNVIDSFNNNIFLNFLSEKSNIGIDELRDIIYNRSNLVMDFERGKMSSDKFFEDICHLIEIELDKEEFIKGFTGIFTPNQPVIDLISKLKPKYKLGLMSDTNDIHFQQIIKKSSVFPMFDAVSLSFELGVFKPDNAIFQDILKKMDLLEEECVFIDDQANYIEAAKKLYFKGVHFTSPDQLVKDLRVLGVE